MVVVSGLSAIRHSTIFGLRVSSLHGKIRWFLDWSGFIVVVYVKVNGKVDSGN